MTRAFAQLPPWTIALLLIAIPHLVFILLQWPHVPMHDGLPVGPTDPDPWLRLTLVREWLTSGDWYNHAVTHSNTPFGGITSPWTRPLDTVIALLVKLQPATTSLNLRLLHAALLLPWIWMVLLLLGGYRLLRLLTPLPAAHLMLSLLIAAMPVTWNYFGLGNADHHAPLAVLFLWALYGVATPAPSRRLTLLTGALFGLQLWISVEALILIGVAYTWYGLHWLRGDRQMAAPLPWLATSIALTVTAATLIERPSDAWLLPVYDSVSIVYVAILTLAALLAWFLWLAPAHTLRTRLLYASFGSAALLATLYALYPAAYRGPMAEVDPFIFSDFLPRISEAKPLLSQRPLYVLGMLLQPLLALILCALPWLRAERSFNTKTAIAPLGFFLVATLLLYLNQQRWSYYLLPLTAVLLAPTLAILFTPEHPSLTRQWLAEALRRLSPNQQILRRLPILIAVVGLPIALGLLNVAMKNKTDQETTERRNACYQQARQLIYSGELNTGALAKPKRLLAPTDLGAEILFFTPHAIVASNYHREGPGIHYVWDADKITRPAELRAHLGQRHIEALLLCPNAEPTEGSILQAIQAGAAPPTWLKKIALPTTHHPDIETHARANTTPVLLVVTGGH